MVYDALDESVRLISGGTDADPVRLSRRRRFAALAVDVDGDVAATLFVRRGAGQFWREAHVLGCRDHQWHMLGGGGYSSDDDGLADRPDSAELLGPLDVSGPGMVLRESGLPPWTARYVNYSVLRAANRSTSSPWPDGLGWFLGTVG